MKQSAGILLYKINRQQLFVLLVHPGGPFFAKKDVGAWSIPKGEYTEEEEPLNAAKREFFEETSHSITSDCLPLLPVTQKSGKRVHAWAAEGHIDVTKIVSNTCEIEWPPRSGKKQHIPEIDRGEWFNVETALLKINVAQQAFIYELQKLLIMQNRITS